MFSANSEVGVNVAALPLTVMVPETPLMKNVVDVTVDESSVLENVAVTDAPSVTPSAPSAGVTESSESGAGGVGAAGLLSSLCHPENHR